jgi:undecaprenyl-diphosphatase
MFLDASTVIRSWDERHCAACNRLNAHLAWARLFAVVSRLGDGWAWYLLAAGLLLHGGGTALPAVAAMAVFGGLGVAFQHAIKGFFRRQRPCDVHPGLLLSVAPLDRFSFPSGHTLHAIGFAVLVSLHAPWLALLVWPFALLIAASRLVLGLHWPSDVAAGALLGACLAGAAELIVHGCGLG